MHQIQKGGRRRESINKEKEQTTQTNLYSKIGVKEFERRLEGKYPKETKKAGSYNAGEEIW